MVKLEKLTHIIVIITLLSR